jgi:hypothetical protein
MPSPPYGLHLAAMDTLAIRSATSALPRSDPGIGPKPVVTDATRSLASVRHDDSSSPCPSTTLSSILDYRAGGSFLMSTGGSLFPSAEGVNHWSRSNADLRIDGAADVGLRNRGGTVKQEADLPQGRGGCAVRIKRVHAVVFRGNIDHIMRRAVNGQAGHIKRLSKDVAVHIKSEQLTECR